MEVSPDALQLWLRTCAECLVLLDTRNACAFAASHIINAHSAVVSTLLLRRLARKECVRLADVVLPGVPRIESCRASNVKVVLYDQCDAEYSETTRLLLRIFNAEQVPVFVLQGGMDLFARQFPELCSNAQSCSSPESTASCSPSPPPTILDFPLCLTEPTSSPGITEVRPHLFLGSETDAADGSILAKHSITHVLNLTCTPSPSSPTAVTSTWLPIRDSHTASLTCVLPAAFRLIDEVKEHHGRILVHCKAGVSRSASVVLAYLMSRDSLPLAAAFTQLKALRPCVSPNLNFMGQLHKMDIAMQRSGGSGSTGSTGSGASASDQTGTGSSTALPAVHAHHHRSRHLSFHNPHHHRRHHHYPHGVGVNGGSSGAHGSRHHHHPHPRWSDAPASQSTSSSPVVHHPHPVSIRDRMASSPPPLIVTVHDSLPPHDLLLPTPDRASGRRSDQLSSSVPCTPDLGACWHDSAFAMALMGACAAKEDTLDPLARWTGCGSRPSVADPTWQDDAAECCGGEVRGMVGAATVATAGCGGAVSREQSRDPSCDAACA